MPRVDIQASMDKYKRNTSAAADDYVAGARAVTVSPTAKAAAAVDKYARGVQDAVSSGSYVAGLTAVSLSDWQQSVETKGKRNYQNGTQNLSNKAKKNMADVMTFAGQVSAEIQAMPSDTPSDMDQRMLANVEKFRQYRKR
jgi:hypothetical protein